MQADELDAQAAKLLQRTHQLVLGVPPAGDELVGRLDVAMDDASRVSGIEPSAILVYGSSGRITSAVVPGSEHGHAARFHAKSVRDPRHFVGSGRGAQDRMGISSRPHTQFASAEPPRGRLLARTTCCDGDPPGSQDGLSCLAFA